MKRVRCRINIGKGYQMSATIVCRLEIGDKVIVGEQFSKNRSPAICLIELEDKRELAAASTPQIERMHEMLQLRSHQQALFLKGVREVIFSRLNGRITIEREAEKAHRTEEAARTISSWSTGKGRLQKK
jgi:hypothetical protein